VWYKKPIPPIPPQVSINQQEKGEMIMSNETASTKIAVFKGKQIRKTIHNNEWWFVINDVIESLTDSNDPAQYFKRLKQRDEELAKLTDKGGVQFVPPLMLEVETTGGKQKMYCWNTEGIFRLIQSIPSPKAEPFKRWLARQGGAVAGKARKAIEAKSGRKVISQENHLKRIRHG
jgi:prophage antirepressor-like protein